MNDTERADMERAARDTREMYRTFVDAGFTDSQAFELLMTYVTPAAATATFRTPGPTARDGTPGAVITDLLASLPAGSPPLSRRDRRRHK